MKTSIKIIVLFFLISTSLSAQKYITKNGNVSFYSDSPAEKIEAHNQQVNSAVDIESGEFVFKVLIKSFEFEKALMQEHFNENYMESDKYPNATFSGKISNIKEINLKKDGTYKTKVEGDLSIHGITKKVAEEGTFEVKDGKIRAQSKFYVLLKDYEIKVPTAVVKNIAERIEITVDVTLSALNK